MKDETSRAKKDKSQYLIPAAIVAAGLIIGLVILFVSANKEPKKSEGTLDKGKQTAQEEGTNTKVDVSVDDDYTKGNKDAKVTIIEFSDFECPYCGKYVLETLPQIEEEYIKTNKVKYVFRDFPLSFHTDAQKAAEAADCAGEQGKYWEMHDKLFTNQDNLKIDNLKKYASEFSLDTEKFNSCLDSGKYEEEVKKDLKDGEAAGVSGTPAFFINGRELVGAQPFEQFKEIIEEELAK